MSLTAQGFTRARLNEIKADYDQRFIDALGPVNTAPDSVVGQMIGIFSAALDDAYEALQATYDAMYPSTAEGVSLDGAVSFVGLERLAASPTVVIAMCYGAEGTLVPAGAIARALDNRQYVTSADAVISRASAGDVLIAVTQVSNAANYQIIAGGVSVVYTSDASATEAEILAGLAALFDPNNFTAEVVGTELRMRAANLQDGFTLTVDSKLAINLLGTPVTFTAVELGAHALPAQALTTIDSSVVGWDSVLNLVPGDIGRFVETDEELRERHANSVRVTGAATVQAIRSRLLAEVDAVTYVSIYENRTGAIDSFGLPSHSFETVVEGGTNQEVGTKLFAVKPAGIQTYGNTSVNVLDENGDIQVVSFSRPVNKFAWIRVSVNLLNAEEVLTTDVEQAIKDAVVAYGSSLNIGEDIIVQRFYGPIYGATSGIGAITVEAAVTSTEAGSPVYSAVNVAMARAELAVFADVRVSVLGV